MDLKQYIIENINQELVFSKYLGQISGPAAYGQQVR